MFPMSKVTEFVCNKYYHVVYRRDFLDPDQSVNGLLLNYSGGNVVLLSEKGIYHIKYRDVVFMRPIEPPTNKLSEEFCAWMDSIKEETMK